MRQVVARAPDISLGYSGLALSSAQLAQFSTAEEAVGLRADARKAAARALELDPRSGEAYLAQAVLAPPHDVVEQETLYRRGLAVEPESRRLNSNLAALLDDVGRTAEALAQQQRSVMLDSLSPRKNTGLAALQRLRKSCRGYATIERAAKLWPANTNVWMTRVYLLAIFSVIQTKHAPSWIQPDKPPPD